MNYLTINNQIAESCFNDIQNLHAEKAPWIHFTQNYPFEEGVIEWLTDQGNLKFAVEFRKPNSNETEVNGKVLKYMGFVIYYIDKDDEKLRVKTFVAGATPTDGNFRANFFLNNITDKKPEPFSDLDMSSEYELSLALAAFNIFHEVQTRAVSRYKTLMLCKKYERRFHEHGEQLESKVIDFGNGITYCCKKDSDPVRDYTRRCEAWGVRGHYRHYKSGKTIFIESYTKGEGRLKDSVYETIKENW